MTEEPQPTKAVEVFYSYSHKDARLRDALEEHLALLERQGVISDWYDRDISAGDEWAGAIDEHLKTADLILLLVSVSFLASDYCYDCELKTAMERHEAGDARVVPVILQPCDWTTAPFSKLQALPKDARPVTKWRNRAEAFTNVAEGIRRVAEEIIARRTKEASRGVTTDAENARNASVERGAISLLPRPPAVGFVSRHNEEQRDIVALLREELTPEKNQVVVLWGAGGAGKTTLAAEVVRAAAGVFKRRVAWISSLRRIDFNLATLLDEVATQLGCPELRTLAPEAKAAQVAALVSAAPALVVLDNFETIAAEEQARCLDFLVQGAACPALITTRSRVDRDDVYNVTLSQMTMAEARDFLRRLAKHTRKPSIFNRLDCDDLITKCEGNPLVLQWVVRQIDLAKRPQEVLADLSQGVGTAAEHVFTRSFDRPELGDDGRTALLALSLFTPSASPEALAEVSGFGDDLRRLQKAVGRLYALWLADTTEAHERLLLRGLTRELAKSRLLKDARADEFRRRYFRYFLRYADAHQQTTPQDLDALEAEKDNILGAMDAALELRDWESVMHMSAALVRFLHLRGHWDEAIKSGEQAQAAACELKNEAKVARFKGNVGLIRWKRGEYEEARRLYEEAFEISKRLEGTKSVAVCLHRLGMLAKDQGNLEEARRLCEESLKISDALDDRFNIGQTVWGLGNIALKQGKVDEAGELLNKSLSIFTDLKDQANTSGVLHQLASVAKRQGKMSEARRLYDESLKMAEGLGHQNTIATALRSLGQFVNEQGNSKEAARLLRKSLRIYETLGSPEAVKVREDLARVAGKSA